MGVIQRQGIKNSLVNYLGAVIGMLSTVFVYNLAPEAYGHVQAIKSAALLFLPLANWGIQNLTIRFFPTFKTEDGSHHGFLSFLLLAASGAFLVFVLLVFLFWDQIFAYYQNREAESHFDAHFLWYFIPLTYMLVLVNMLTNYISNFQRIVLPAVFHDLFLKFVVPAIILLFYFDYIDLAWVIRIFLLAYVIIVGFLLLYLRHLGELHFVRPDAQIWKHAKSMTDFAGFTMLGSLGSVLALQLDTFMMASLDNMYNTGVYSMAITISMAIGIPHRSISNISAPLIAASWQKNDTDHIRQLYRQTSLLLLIAGTFLLVEIGINFPDLCTLSPKEDVMLDAYQALLILGVGRIIDMGTSINGYIIQYSSRYRVNVYFILFLGLLNVGMNVLLIPRFGMEGAALATAVSLTSYNILRTLYVHIRFKMFPFHRNTLYVLLLGGLAAVVGWWLPDTPSAIINMVYRGAVVAILFLGPIYWWKLSPELNQALDEARKKLLG